LKKEINFGEEKQKPIFNFFDFDFVRRKFQKIFLPKGEFHCLFEKSWKRAFTKFFAKFFLMVFLTLLINISTIFFGPFEPQQDFRTQKYFKYTRNTTSKPQCNLHTTLLQCKLSR